MTCEQLWYDYCVQTGRPPEPQPLPAHELADPTLPLRLALAGVEQQAFEALAEARHEARKRAGGPVGAFEVAHVLRMRLGRITE